MKRGKARYLDNLILLKHIRDFISHWELFLLLKMIKRERVDFYIKEHIKGKYGITKDLLNLEILIKWMNILILKQ